MDDEFDRARREMKLAEFQAWVKGDAKRAAAWAERLRRDDEARQAPAQWPLSVWRVPHNGRGLDIKTIPIGCPHVVRAVSEIVILNRHWWANKESAVCFEAECKHCPSIRRVPEGYFDAIMARRLADGRSELFRAVQCVPAAGLSFFEGKTIRGSKISFCRPYKNSPTTVELVDATCNRELPQPIDVREPLIRRWNIPYWPGSDAKEEGGPSEILKFRKQA